MTRVHLLPRMKKRHVHDQLEHMRVEGFKPAYQGVRDDPAMYYATSGGSLDAARIEDLVKRIREEARQLGFPASIGRKVGDFDTRVTILLAQEEWLNTGEALRDDVWSYIATMMLPDVVVWRFPSANDERFLGGVRNTFQRLWTRGVVLDRGELSDDRWALIERLGEETLVQIFERSGLSNNPVLARHFAEGYLSWVDNVDQANMQRTMRDAMMILLLRNKIIDLSLLSEERMHQEVWLAFRTAWEKRGCHHDDTEQDIERSRKGFLKGLMFWRR
ncbi:hypothetical protein [Halomonas caseinilytica]|uniref:Uncharacterized protein n=1 Tax=Halomonas caseinilytica TaxID=438744 RepID=A0A1M6VG38_9GAMM|nr:hypothetical protein [Halomonas caseinilytica]SHK80429.1 hypothetical protein SAMN05192556_105188 [Halomonas caseinilytica]